MSMDPVVAELILAEAHAANLRTKQAIRGSLALPLALMAAVQVVAAPVVLIVGRDHLMPFFGASFVAVSVVAWRRQRRAALENGVRPSIVPWVVTVTVVLIGAIAASKIGHDQGLRLLNLAGPFAANALAVGMLAWWVRSRWLALVAVVLPCASVLVVLLVDGDAAIAAQSLVYAALLAGASRKMGT